MVIFVVCSQRVGCSLCSRLLSQSSLWMSNKLIHLFPFVCYQLTCRQPLPLNPSSISPEDSEPSSDEDEDSYHQDAQGDNHPDWEENEEDSEDELTEKSFLPPEAQGTNSRSTSRRGDPTPGRSIKKKKRRTKSSNQDEENLDPRSNISTLHHSKRKLIRENHHPVNMSTALTRKVRSAQKRYKEKKAAEDKAKAEAKKKRQQKAKRKALDDEEEEEGGAVAKRKKDGEESEASGTDAEADEDAKMKAKDEEIARLQVKCKLALQKKKASGSKKVVDRDDSLVAQAAKNHLFPKKKFISSDARLEEVTRYVMKKFQPKEHLHLKGTKLVEAQEHWVLENQDTVRIAMNKHRNYIQGEIKKVFDDFHKAGEVAEIPTTEELIQILSRDGLVGDTPEAERLRSVFVFFWDKIMARVCGDKKWCPRFRHYATMSTAEDPQEPGVLLVQPQDEAFAVLVWENYSAGWHYKAKWQYIDKKEIKDLPTEKGNPEEFKKIPTTLYTDAKGGVKKFGGWSKSARKRLAVLEKMVEEGRKKKHNKQVEEACLEAVRQMNRRDDVDARRMSKGKKPKTVEADTESDDESVFDEDL